MLSFQITMLVLTICTALELTTGAFTKLYKHVVNLSISRRVTKAEQLVEAAKVQFKKSKTPEDFFKLEHAELQLEQAKFVRDVTA